METTVTEKEAQPKPEVKGMTDQEMRADLQKAQGALQKAVQQMGYWESQADAQKGIIAYLNAKLAEKQKEPETQKAAQEGVTALSVTNGTRQSRRKAQRAK